MGLLSKDWSLGLNAGSLPIFAPFWSSVVRSRERFVYRL